MQNFLSLITSKVLPQGAVVLLIGTSLVSGGAAGIKLIQNAQTQAATPVAEIKTSDSGQVLGTTDGPAVGSPTNDSPATPAAATSQSSDSFPVTSAFVNASGSGSLEKEDVREAHDENSESKAETSRYDD